MYKIDIDLPHNLISTRLIGYLTPEEVSAYIGEMAAQFIRHRMKPGYLLMIDTTEATLQSQDAIAAFQRHIAGFPKARRIAIVNGSSLARMQVRRVMTQDYARIVGSVEEAHGWLFDGVEALAA